MALYVTQHAYTHIRIHLDPLHDTLSTIYQSMFNYAYSVQCTHNTLITTSITFNQTYVRTSYTHNTCITGPHTAHQPKHLSICVQSGIQCTHTTPVSLAHTQHTTYSNSTSSIMYIPHSNSQCINIIMWHAIHIQSSLRMPTSPYIIIYHGLQVIYT